MRSPWTTWWALNPMISVLLRGRGGELRRGRREGRVKTEAEIGVMQPQSKEHLEPPEAGRDKEGISLRSLRGERSPADTLILDFWPLEL